jgi:hypothetical protein
VSSMLSMSQSPIATRPTAWIGRNTSNIGRPTHHQRAQEIGPRSACAGTGWLRLNCGSRFPSATVG